MALQERALIALHEAAIELLRQGKEEDGMLLLSYVVWPSERLRSGTPRSTTRIVRRTFGEQRKAGRLGATASRR